MELLIQTTTSKKKTPPGYLANITCSRNLVLKEPQCARICQVTQRLRAGKTMQELEPESSSSTRAALCPPPAPCIISYTSSSHSGLHAPLTTPLPRAITGKGHRPLLPQGMLLNCRKVEIYRKLQRIKTA